ncbi:MAG: hypothetical protein J5496_08495 [Lachnospiraceae bacterium]|nr:hypothetical protein [Lachnospiraceae bacterium]
MKKHVVLLILVFFCVGCLLSVLFFLQKAVKSDTQTTETFDLSEYKWENKTFSAVQNFGEVNEKNTAIQIAKRLWAEKYSNDVPQRRIKAAYDSNEECWHVFNTVPPNMLGGVFHAIIQKDGDVLAVWCED